MASAEAAWRVIYMQQRCETGVLIDGLLTPFICRKEHVMRALPAATFAETDNGLLCHSIQFKKHYGC